MLIFSIPLYKTQVITLCGMNFNGLFAKNKTPTLLKNHLKIKYIIKTTKREEVLEIPEIALREAVVNSVVHRDYFEKGSNIFVEIFDDKVEISNPGGLVKGLTEHEFGKRSVTRNPLIASLMLRANYIEKLGTGISRIQNSLSEVGLPFAEFDKTDFFVIRFQRIANLSQLQKIESINTNVIDDNNNNLNLNFFEKSKVKEKRYLRLMLIMKFIINSQNSNVYGIYEYIVGTNQNIVGTNQNNVGINQESVGINQESVSINQENVGINVGINDKISIRTIERDLELLKNYDLIEFIGSKKTGKYVVTDFYWDFMRSIKQNSQVKK